uniref:Uncharacterized protein n=1 Tax=Glossina austeni TaxID=7395 RepID=A0A1A9USX6_GLOAU
MLPVVRYYPRHARGDEKVVDEESFLTFWLMLSTDAAARYEEAKLKSDDDGAVIAGTSSLVSMPVVVCMCVGIIVVDDELIKRLRTLKTGRREAIEPLNAAVVGVRIYSKGVIKYKTAPNEIWRLLNSLTLIVLTQQADRVHRHTPLYCITLRYVICITPKFQKFYKSSDQHFEEPCPPIHFESIDNRIVLPLEHIAHYLKKDINCYIHQDQKMRNEIKSLKENGKN